MAVGDSRSSSAVSYTHLIQRDLEMVADVSPAVVMHMVVAQHLHRITVIAAATAAMHHYHIDVSHRHHSQVCSNRTDSSPRGVGRFGRWTLE